MEEMWNFSRLKVTTLVASLTLVLGVGTASAQAVPQQSSGRPGIDVSAYDPVILWPAVKESGVEWAYVKATEGTTYKSPLFSAQYGGAASAGLIRGAYHFALPDSSSGATQANYFVSNGGGWSADGITLPPMVDLEYNPYGASCYGLTAAAMVAWIQDFSDTIHAKTGRYPVIYTSYSWWDECTGNSAEFNNNPLFIANHESTPGTLPASWTSHTFWQHEPSTLPLISPGNKDLFNGTYAELQAFAIKTP